MNQSPSNRRVLFVAAGLVLTGAVGYAQFKDYESARGEVFATPNGKAFLETYAALRENYLRDTSPDKLMQGALTGMIDSLNDEFTYYLPADVSANQSEDTKGEFFGIGVGILPVHSDGTGVRVETVYRGSPAATAGLQSGDVITKVDGKSVDAMALTKAVRLIRGPKGSVVTLNVLRDGVPLDVKVTRDKINVVNVSSTVLPGDVGYVAVSDFLNEKVESQLHAALKSLEAKKVRGVILDLRNNPGGLVTQAIAVADAFLQKGDIFITRDRKGKVSVEAAATASKTDYTGKLVVLVNDSSASASEIVASALQENGRAKLVGEKTYGKGVANVPVRLSNGGQVNVAFEEWLTPKRNSIFKKGVTPDAVVPDTRFPKLLTIEGVNAKPGETITVQAGGKTLKLKADANGQFTYQQDPERVKTSDQQGKALVDVASDAEVRKALELLSAPVAQR